MLKNFRKIFKKKRKEKESFNNYQIKKNRHSHQLTLLERVLSIIEHSLRRKSKGRVLFNNSNIIACSD